MADLEPSISRVPMSTIFADGGDALIGRRVVVGGFVKSGRVQGHGTFAFLKVSDGSCARALQVIVDAAAVQGQYPLARLTPTGTSVTVEGVLERPPVTPRGKERVELRALRVSEVGEVRDAAAYPLPKCKISLETLRDNVHLRARTDTIGAVARVSSRLVYETYKFFHDNGFLNVHTPIITTSDCEGAGEMFQITTLLSQYSEKLDAKRRHQNPAPTTQADTDDVTTLLKKAIDAATLLKEAIDAATPVVAQLKESSATATGVSKEAITAAVSELTAAMKQVEKPRTRPGIPTKDDGTVDYERDFFKRPAFLTVSGQLQAETYACALSSVFTFGPTFRAEKSHTSRHLAEFWMVEPEIAFANLQDDMDCAERYVQYLCKSLLQHCREDLEILDVTAIERLELVSSSPFERISYTKAVEILGGVEGVVFQNKVQWGMDLASEHERYLTEVIYKKPVIVYNYPREIKAFYMRLNDDQKTVAAMDVLVPKVGELIGGSQREERLDVLIQRLQESGLALESYEWYLDLRRFGTVKHSGFGMGFERMMLFATGMDNIRDVIPFPRYPGRADL